MDVKLLQSSNKSVICNKLSPGTDKSLNLRQPEKAFLPRFSTEFGMTTDSSAAHHEKQFLPIEVTESGIVIA